MGIHILILVKERVRALCHSLGISSDFAFSSSSSSSSRTHVEYGPWRRLGVCLLVLGARGARIVPLA